MKLIIHDKCPKCLSEHFKRVMWVGDWHGDEKYDRQCMQCKEWFKSIELIQEEILNEM